MVYTFNPRTLETEAGRPLSLRPFWSPEWVPGQLELVTQRILVSKKKRKRIKKKGGRQRSICLACSSTKMGGVGEGFFFKDLKCYFQSRPLVQEQGVSTSREAQSSDHGILFATTPVCPVLPCPLGYVAPQHTALTECLFFPMVCVHLLQMTALGQCHSANQCKVKQNITLVKQGPHVLFLQNK